MSGIRAKVRALAVQGLDAPAIAERLAVPVVKVWHATYALRYKGLLPGKVRPMRGKGLRVCVLYKRGLRPREIAQELRLGVKDIYVYLERGEREGRVTRAHGLRWAKTTCSKCKAEGHNAKNCKEP